MSHLVAYPGVSVILGAFKLGMTMVAVVTVDSWGRRPLLLAGVSGMVLSLAVLGAGQADWTPDYMSTWGSVAGLLVFVGGYQVMEGGL